MARVVTLAAAARTFGKVDHEGPDTTNLSEILKLLVVEFWNGGMSQAWLAYHYENDVLKLDPKRVVGFDPKRGFSPN